jgi:quercetin dioxygenase-like cupin family protein
MIVLRWQAPVLPTPEQIKMIFEGEGLEATEETFPPKSVIADHRHPFDEVRMVVSGAMFLNIAGNQLLLRAGDRIEIPANTRHSKSTDGDQSCVSLVASRTF